MYPLQSLLAQYRKTAQTQREKGTYFEELIRTYLRHEATYADLYSDVWLYAHWAKTQKLSADDTGIDLVAKTHGTNEYHAIQCKFYAEDHRIQKKDIDSFFTASGQKPFTHRVIITTSNNWSEKAEQALTDQQPPVSKIDLVDLENSQIDWSQYQPDQPPILKGKKTLRPHQSSALLSVTKRFETEERGKLIMACGTGKTFTSLKIAEEIAGAGGRVLFLVPSLSLLSQTLTEWTQESATPLHSFAVCSDSEVGKKRKKDEDIVQTFAHELRYPATTDAKRLARETAKRHDAQHMSVVFSTYHSIDVVSGAQLLHDMTDFDLIICDEAHRTTGATFENESESNFVKVHDAAFLRSAKRLYMTATPRIYADMAKATAERDGAAICSMDDPAIYGDQFHLITFSEAVSLGLLCDYKVVVLTIDSDHVSDRLQQLLADDNNQLRVDDAARIIGCWKAPAKEGLQEDLNDPAAMQRAVAFAQVIEPQRGASSRKVSSKEIASMFQAVVDAYQEQDDADINLACESAHVDGSMNATEKDQKLDWLRAEPPENTCRILSNVRCLSEGVDVPSLDAVLFLSPRKSQVDVVQSVGRVMRNAPGKKLGYVILPVVIPHGMTPSEALNDNQVYKVVWEVLQALRSHDDRFDSMINKLEYIGKDPRKMEVVAVTDQIQRKSAALSRSSQSRSNAQGSFSIGETPDDSPTPVQAEIQFQVGELERALYAKVVKKCGNRNYWDDWAKDIGRIAQTHIQRITTIVNDAKNTKEVAAFQAFANELRDDLNDAISDGEVIEMLAQHLITKPVFDALFENYSFASHNPVSQAMQQVLDILQEHRLDKEADTLEKFYASVEMRAAGIENAAGKQKIVVELYDKFFRNAFPKMTERLGIVYTPVEVVDFIIHSINDLLQQEFGQTLCSEGVHILDPFTGTGTFITRLLQSGLISKDQLAHKYKNEIHANELVLLAYYIAAINIEAVYHGLAGGDYEPFRGICLTDTFRLEEEDLVSELLANNSERRKRQQKLDVRVIMGNPPYSAGQESANDNNQNVAYPTLDARIRDTYAAHSKATLKNALYDSYIRAIRWASDRLGDAGIIGIVTNAGFLEANTADGLRKCLAEEFSNIYVFHLRGNARTSGEQRRKEKDNVFGQGTRTPIAISLLVKNPKAKQNGQILWQDIGDYLSQEEKLKIVREFGSVEGISKSNTWTKILPDTHNDWVNQRDESFDHFIKIGDKKNLDRTLFSNFARGMMTCRDAWVYNYSKEGLVTNVNKSIEFYSEHLELKTPLKSNQLLDPKMISWTRSLEQNFEKRRSLKFNSSAPQQAIYRPYAKLWSYYDRSLVDQIGVMPSVFTHESHPNCVITVTGVGSNKEFSALVSTSVTDLEVISKGQCFPLYLYEKASADTADADDLFASQASASVENGYTRKDGISDAGFAHFQAAYPK